MKKYLWISTIVLVIIVALVFIPISSNYYLFTTSVVPYNGEVILTGSMQKSTLNVFRKGIKDTQKASFIQCSFSDTNGLKEEISIDTNPDLHNCIVDVAITDNQKISLSDVTLENKERKKNEPKEYTTVIVTCFDNKNEPMWEKKLGSYKTYGEGIAIYNDLIYITGNTRSPDFPAESTFKETINSDSKFFIICLDLTGNMKWSTLIEGTDDSLITSCAYDQNHLLVTGYTYSPDYPVKNAFQETLNGSSNAFVTCFDLMGNMEWSTYLGGTGISRAQTCTIDKNNLYIAGYTSSTEFPVKDAFQDVLKGKRLENPSLDFVTRCAFLDDPLTNAFLTKFTTSGELETSTYIDYNGYSLANYHEHPYCMLSMMENGDIFLAIYGVSGSDKNKIFEANHDIYDPNTLLYTMTKDCKVISHHYLF